MTADDTGSGTAEEREAWDAAAPDGDVRDTGARESAAAEAPEEAPDEDVDEEDQPDPIALRLEQLILGAERRYTPSRPPAARASRSSWPPASGGPWASPTSARPRR